MLDEIQKIREYLSYLEEHYCNVQWGWDRLGTRCSGLIEEICEANGLDLEQVVVMVSDAVRKHDVSKLHDIEFNSYRRYFFPTEKELFLAQDNKAEETYATASFKEAWEHHKHANKHHWENWTISANQEFTPTVYDVVSCIHMMCDWMAMSRRKDEAPLKYYMDNKVEIILPDWADKLVIQMLTKAYMEV